MKFYLHKETNEPMGLIEQTMIDLVSDKCNEQYPSQSDERKTIYLVVFPNRQLGNGIKFHSITHQTLLCFKRINKQKFAEVCSDFGQYRHKNDNGKNLSMFHSYIQQVKNSVKTFGN